MNEKLEMAKNSLYNANEIKDIKENPVVESVLLAPIKAIPVLGDLSILHEQKRQCKGWQRPIKLSILEILYEMVICRGNI